MASKVGFVGLDEYSVDMAASLIRSGYKVQAFEVYDSLVDKFLQLGGIRCASPMEAGKDVSALVVVLSHVDQSDDIFCGHEGVFKGLQKGTIIILRSTILPLYIQKLEKTLTEVDETACVVDAYVSRGMSEILHGKLMITSSGRSYAIVRARPLLSAMCEKLYVFEGDVGAGSKVKMVNEHLKGIHLIASVEAISLGVQFRIHPWILYDIISNAAGNSWTRVRDR